MGSRGPLKQQDAARGTRPQRSLVSLPGTVEIPEPPEGLLPETVARWEAFWRSDMARHVQPAADMGRIIRWVQAWDEWIRATRAFKKKRVVSGSQGQPVLNPLGGYIDKLEGVIARAEMEFGMTPMARARLGLTAAQGAVTAAQLNRMLSRDRSNEAEPAVIDGDWDAA